MAGQSRFTGRLGMGDPTGLHRRIRGRRSGFYQSIRVNWPCFPRRFASTLLCPYSPFPIWPGPSDPACRLLYPGPQVHGFSRPRESLWHDARPDRGAVDRPITRGPRSPPLGRCSKVAAVAKSRRPRRLNKRAIEVSEHGDLRIKSVGARWCNRTMSRMCTTQCGRSCGPRLRIARGC